MSMTSKQNWVLITAAGLRLGRSLCTQFAQAGWSVLAHYHSSRDQALQTQEQVRSLGVGCELLHADLGAELAADQLFSQATALLGQAPRCIVNNASQFVQDDAYNTNSAALHRNFGINTISPILLANRLAEWVRSSPAAAPGHYSVIHVLDQKVHNLNPDYFSYTMSKLALERAVALQARALSPWVRVCGLSPGLMCLSGDQTPANFARAARCNLLRTPLLAEDVAAGAVFLASTAGICGCTFVVDNGQHLVALDRDVMFAIEATEGA